MWIVRHLCCSLTKGHPLPWKLQKHLSPHSGEGLQGIYKAAISCVYGHIAAQWTERAIYDNESIRFYIYTQCSKSWAQCCTTCVMWTCGKSYGRRQEPPYLLIMALVIFYDLERLTCQKLVPSNHQMLLYRNFIIVMFSSSDLKIRPADISHFQLHVTFRFLSFPSSCNRVKTHFRDLLIHGIQEPSTPFNMFYIPPSCLALHRRAIGLMLTESINIHRIRNSLLMLKIK